MGTVRKVAAAATAVGAALLVASCGGGPDLPKGLIISTTSLQSTVPTTVPDTLPTTVPGTVRATSPETSTETSASGDTSAATAPTTAVQLPVSGPMVTGRGPVGYLHGANLPWVNWGCDFGCGSDGGASSDEVQSVAGDAFATAALADMRIVRWWVFPGDPTQIETDRSGLPSGVAERVYVDFDAALALADEHDVDLVFTLFSHPTALPEAWRMQPEGRAALAEALAELFARYGDHPRIHTWQVFNEPEWEIWNGLADQTAVQALVTEIADAVHANSDALVSVGSARIDALGMWVGAGLDYYTAHWYDPMREPAFCAPCTTYPALRDTHELDAPVVIGEFYAGLDIDAQERFQTFLDRGYAGAWAWSLLPDHTQDRLDIDVIAAAAFGVGLPPPDDSSDP